VHDTQCDRYDFAEPVPLQLSTPMGQRLTLSVCRIDVTTDAIMFANVTIADVRLASEEDWLHVGDELDDIEWFEGDVELTLRLDRAITAGIADGDTLVEALFGTEPEGFEHLRTTDAWFLLEAMQPLEVPGNPNAEMSVGARTHWANT